MIDRLIQSLRGFAAPAGQQVERFPELAAGTPDPAFDYADALLLVTDCPQVRLEPAQLDALQEVQAVLEPMTNPSSAKLWTEHALRASPSWTQVRRAALSALAALGSHEPV